MNKEKLLTYLNYFLVVCCGISAFWLASNNIIFAKNPGQPFEMWQMLICAPIVIGLFAAVIAINIKRKLYKPNYVIIGLLGLLFIINMISVLAYKNGTVYDFMSADRANNYSITVAFTAQERVVAIFSFMGVMLGALLLLDILHQVTDLNNDIKIACLVVITIAIIAIIYGLIKFPNRYFLLYKHLTDGQLYHASIPSFFQTKNEYALILYLAVLAGIYLHHYYRKWYWLLGSVYAYINIIHTLSKQMIIIGALTMLAYLICIFFTTYKQHKKMNIIALASIGGTIALAVIAGLIYLGVTGKFQALADTIYFTKGSDTFQTRTYIWEKVLVIINANNWSRGTGHILFGNILHTMNALDASAGEATARYSAHCAYLQYIGEGGILLLTIELAILGYAIYFGVKFSKENKELVVLCFAIITLFLAIMFFESASIGISFTLDYAIITLFSVVPLIDLGRKNNKIFLGK